MQQHPATEDGNPLVDMQTMMPTSRLDDPGIGCAATDDGCSPTPISRASSRTPTAASRTDDRLHLTGHMERFAWSFDGVKFGDAAPLRLTYGERLRIVLVNDTMMAHQSTCTGCGAIWRTDDGNSACASTR